MEPSRGDQLIHQITENVRNLNNNGKNSTFLRTFYNVCVLVAELEHFVDRIGGPDDDHDAKESLNDLVQSSNALSKRASSQLKELITLSNDQVWGHLILGLIFGLF